MPHTPAHPYKIFNTTAPQQAGLFSVLLTMEIFPFYLTILNKNFHSGLIINLLSNFDNNFQLNPDNTLLNNFKQRQTANHENSHPQPGSAVALQSIQGDPEINEAFDFGAFSLVRFFLRKKK